MLTREAAALRADILPDVVKGFDPDIRQDDVSEGEGFIRTSDGMLFRAAYLGRFLMLDVWSGQSRVRICGRPDCNHLPYFVADHLKQRYCSPGCADWAQREHRKKWWAAHGKEMRERQRAAKKQKAAKKRTKKPKSRKGGSKNDGTH